MSAISHQSNKNATIMKQIRHCVINNISQLNRNDNSDVEVYFTRSCSISNAIFRYIWLAIGILCVIMSFYQIYDRIDYYLSTPVRTDVAVIDKPINKPPLLISSIATASLKPYWDLRQNKDDDRCSVLYVPFRLLFVLSKSINNISKFWAATNVTPSIEKIEITQVKHNLAHVHFDSGTITHSANASLINWHEKNTAFGLATAIETHEDPQPETATKIQLIDGGYCSIPIAMIVIDSLLPFHDISNILFGNIVTVIYEVKKYRFLNTQKSPCMSDKKIEQCFRDCLIAKYRTKTCWLPFMPIIPILRNCNELQNETIVDEVYENSLKILRTITPTLNCSCHKSCTQTITQVAVKYNGKLNDRYKLHIVYKIQDEKPTETSEQFAYDIISLLVDIGGTIGLFLGLSISAIIQLIQLCIVHLFNSIKQNFRDNHKRINALVKEELRGLLRARAKSQNLHLKIRYCKSFFVVIFLTASLFLIYNEMKFYISDPTQTVITITNNGTIYLPKLVACGQGKEIARLKENISKINHVDECLLNILDLIDFRLDSKFNQSVIEKLWQKQTPIWKVTYSKTYVNLVNTHTGRCCEISIEPKSVNVQTATATVLFTTFGNINCASTLFQMYMMSPLQNFHSAIRNQIAVYFGSDSGIRIQATAIHRHNPTSRSCVSFSNFEDCVLNCFSIKLESSASCKLPFMNGINRALCNSSSSAREGITSYLQVVLSGSIQEDCKCMEPCTLTIHKLHWDYSERIPPPNTRVTVVAITDVIENITEIPLRSICSFLCFLGNVLSVTLGISVLSLLQISFVYSNIMFKYIFNIQK